jgi:site-specific DNA-methyltransferase (adenine-specific)
MSNIKNYKYDWVWVKPQGTNPLNAKIMPMKNHENILVFYRKTPTYNPQMTEGKPYNGYEAQEGQVIGEVYGKLKSVHKENKGTRYPLTVQHWPQVRKGLHPTQKPLEMYEYFIKTYTNEGDLVLDSCIGSGTTAEACIKTKRRYLGIEKDETYYNIAINRIKNCT